MAVFGFCGDSQQGVLFLVFTPQGYCFHPWCPDGRVGGRPVGRAGGRAGGRAAGKSLSGLYLRNRKV